MKLLQTLARLWSIASIGILVLFISGQGLPPLTLKSLCFPFGVILGLALAWRFERAGGAIAIGAVLLFYLLEYAGGGGFPNGPWFFAFAAPGLLFLANGILVARQEA